MLIIVTHILCNVINGANRVWWALPNANVNYEEILTQLIWKPIVFLPNIATQNSEFSLLVLSPQWNRSHSTESWKHVNRNYLGALRPLRLQNDQLWRVKSHLFAKLIPVKENNPVCSTRFRISVYFVFLWFTKGEVTCVFKTVKTTWYFNRFIMADSDLECTAFTVMILSQPKWLSTSKTTWPNTFLHWVVLPSPCVSWLVNYLHFRDLHRDFLRCVKHGSLWCFHTNTYHYWSAIGNKHVPVPQQTCYFR